VCDCGAATPPWTARSASTGTRSSRSSLP
jgi:hypothetical protein